MGRVVAEVANSETVPEEEILLIRHVAMFTWTQSAAPAEIQEFASRLSTMPDNVPGIHRYEHGDDLQLGPNTSDYVLVAEFETVEDYRYYANHPYHVAFVEDCVKPILQSISRAQYHLP